MTDATNSTPRTKTVQLDREIIPAVIEITPKADGTTGRFISVVPADTDRGRALLEERASIIKDLVSSPQRVTIPMMVEVLIDDAETETGDDVLAADVRDAAIEGQGEGDASDPAAVPEQVAATRTAAA